MKNSYFLLADQIKNLMKEGAMNSQDGIYLYGLTDKSVEKFLPPPLELADPDNPMFYLYIVNIREPSFAPWYLEGGIGLLAKYGDKIGVYFFSLMLSGPGALMGAFTGREGSGLPKKTCETIIVERTGNYGHCCIERLGVRLVDVELEIGNYNIPDLKLGMEGCADIPGGMLVEEGGCLLHKYRMDDGAIKDMDLIYYHSPSRYYSWEPASATMTLASSINDPWGEMPPVTVLGAAWAVSDNWVKGTSVLYTYPDESVSEAMQYLFAGRYDVSMLCKKHQHYETK